MPHEAIDYFGGKKLPLIYIDDDSIAFGGEICCLTSTLVISQLLQTLSQALIVIVRHYAQGDPRDEIRIRAMALSLSISTLSKLKCENPRGRKIINKVRSSCLPLR
jgi:hypothetical protein